MVWIYILVGTYYFHIRQMPKVYSSAFRLYVHYIVLASQEGRYQEEIGLIRWYGNIL